MPIGTYVHLQLIAEDISHSRDWYQSLGWRALADDLVTDGAINLCFVAESDAETDAGRPGLVYYGVDLDDVRSRFNPDKQKRKATPATGAHFQSPDGLPVQVSTLGAPAEMPDGTPLRRRAYSRFGALGEISLPVRDMPKSVLFWNMLGYEPLHMANIPHPYTILSDGLIVIGLHQNPQQPIGLTYFAPDMADRISRMSTEGLPVRQVGGDGANALLVTPEGLTLGLFTGATPSR